MSWNDHDHRGEYAAEGHTHYDYAEEHHRHYDLERDSESARHDVDELRAAVRDLRDQLDEAFDRIADLEKQTPQARQLQLEADLAMADLAESGYRPDDYGPPVGADRHGRDCQCPFCYYDPEEGETEPTPDALITQAEVAVDDAARRIVAEPGQPTRDLSGFPVVPPGQIDAEVAADVRRLIGKDPS